jgi:hypothetical protein
MKRHKKITQTVYYKADYDEGNSPHPYGRGLVLVCWPLACAIYSSKIVNCYYYYYDDEGNSIFFHVVMHILSIFCIIH